MSEAASEKPRVGIVMGSDSDLPVMLDAAKALREFGIPCEVEVISAHRTPHRAVAYAESAESRGLQVLIAGAGGAAHLAGVLSGLTALPVIGVPLKSTALDGLDALLATVQMPPGVPVAAVAINGARNAGILAAEIVACGDPAIRERVRDHKRRLAESVEERGRQAKERVRQELDAR